MDKLRKLKKPSFSPTMGSSSSSYNQGKCELNHDLEISRLEGKLQSSEQIVASQEIRIDSQNTEISELKKQLQDQRRKFEDQRRKLKDCESELTRLEEKTRVQKLKIVELEEQVAREASAKRREQARLEHESRLAAISQEREANREDFQRKLETGKKAEADWHRNQRQGDFEVEKFRLEKQHESNLKKQEMQFEAFKKLHGE